MFDPVALTCGHIFCYMCACNAASVTIVDGLQSASPKEKCPLCREVIMFSLILSLWVVSLPGSSGYLQNLIFYINGLVQAFMINVMREGFVASKYLGLIV